MFGLPSLPLFRKSEVSPSAQPCTAHTCSSTASKVLLLPTPVRALARVCANVRVSGYESKCSQLKIGVFEKVVL